MSEFIVGLYQVYVHRKATDNTPFYVGLGKQSKWRTYNRAKDTWHRSQEWKDIYKECGRTIEIVKANITLKEADVLERELIAKYGRKQHGKGPLVNRTSGGQTPLGTEQAKGKDDPYANRIIDVHTGDVIFYGYREVSEFYGVDKSHVGKVLRASKETWIQKEWGLMREDEYLECIAQGKDPVEELSRKAKIAKERFLKATKYERTEEHKARMRQGIKASKKFWASRHKIGKKGAENPMSKKVMNVETGERWDCVVEAAKANGMNRHQMSRRCAGKIDKDKRFQFVG